MTSELYRLIIAIGMLLVGIYFTPPLSFILYRWNYL